MSRKRRMFDIELPQDEETGAAPEAAEAFPAGKADLRRGPALVVDLRANRGELGFGLDTRRQFGKRGSGADRKSTRLNSSH